MIPSSSSSVSATASSLRWRARIAKEAILMGNDDDNSAEVSRTATVQDDDYDLDSQKLLRRRNTNLGTALLPLVLPLLVSVAVASSLYALRSSRSLLVTVPVTCTVLTAVLVLWQQYMLRSSSSSSTTNTSLRGLQAAVRETSHKLQSLRMQRERWYRQVMQLDAKAERLREIQTELCVLLTTSRNKKGQESASESATSKSTIDGLDFSNLARIAQAYKQCRLDLQKHLQYQVQEQILKAVLFDSQQRNQKQQQEQASRIHGQLSEGDLERLIRSLKAMPGVSFQEAYLREILVDSTASSSSSSPSPPSSSTLLLFTNVFRLLRQVASDGEAADIAATATLTTPQRRQRYRRKQQPSVVFTFDAQQLLRTRPDNTTIAEEEEKGSLSS